MTFSKFVFAPALIAAACLAGGTAMAAATVGQPAPAFSVTDTGGKTVNLADYKGKYVVMEWVNPGCPFVVKHYGAANMQATQKDATAKGAVWLTVSSTAPGAGDYKKPAELGKWMQQQGGAPTATLMDDDGKVGRAYGAKATPHTFVIDPQGKLIYAGAIDSKPTANPADIPAATNYVKTALAEAMAGKPVSTPTTQAYGCSVKYSS
ncbi:thioredoxin family protein [Rivibacter subsaxonicus]|uniref:Peroxiredoxin n=1 Tax=Rivibacter subsaxonicus TaxID=457575 RepID=A0A4Q7W1Y8_9BURK|nr:thioredoxin family protein [Rivibacter subsaxonicus]RZU02569.1 peroxiredoxin [Rivibacter subsaxonicus]